jgi:ABC-type transporter Mla MlaB component
LAAPDEHWTQPWTPARAPSGPGTIVLAIGGPIARADIPALCERVEALLESSSAGVVVCDVGDVVEPDAVTVDTLARLALATQRRGRQLRLRNTCPDLLDLLALMGLVDVVGAGAGAGGADGEGFEPRRQAEEREQALGVEERAEPADPPP